MENTNIKFLSPIDGDPTDAGDPLAGDESKSSSQEMVQYPEMQTRRSMDRPPGKCHLTETSERNSSINNDTSTELATSVQYPCTDSRASKSEKANKKRYPRKRNAAKLIPGKNQRQEELSADQQGKANNYIVFPIEHPTTTGYNFLKDENEMKAPDLKAGLLKKKTTKNAQEHALRQRQRRCRAGKAFSKLREMLPGIEPRANQSKVIDHLAAYLRYFNTIVHSSDIETYHTYFANDLIAGKIDPLTILGISHETFLRNLLPQSNLMESTTRAKDNIEHNQEKNYETKDFLMNQFAAHFSKLHETMDVGENDA